MDADPGGLKMNSQQLAEKFIQEILDNDEDGAHETYAILLGRWRQGEPLPDFERAASDVWKRQLQ
jgi:hypothetical protein